MRFAFAVRVCVVFVLEWLLCCVGFELLRSLVGFVVDCVLFVPSLFVACCLLCRALCCGGCFVVIGLS